jgi:hypothetical protein
MSTSSPSYTLTPFSPTHIPQTSELLFTSKLGLTINRLLFKNWPNEAVQRRNYSSVLESLPRSGVEALSVLDEDSGEVLGHLCITRKRAVEKKEENKGEEKAVEEQEVPDFFNPEVLSAVQAAVSELSSGLSVDHLGTLQIPSSVPKSHRILMVPRNNIHNRLTHTSQPRNRQDAHGVRLRQSQNPEYPRCTLLRTTGILVLQEMGI